MKALAAFVMRGRMQAILVTGVSALLSLLLPPLSYLSGAALSLVTLRVGPGAGLSVLAGAALAVGALALLLFGGPWIVGVFLIALWLPVWVLSVTLRRTVDLRRALLVAATFGVALVLGVYATVDDPAGWWLETYRQLMAQTGSEPPGPEASAALQEIARLMTGVAAAAFTLSVLGSLLIGRWWQALLFNPGGFRDEFHRLTVGRILAVAVMVLLALAAVLGGAGGALAAELVMVALLLFLLQGVAVVHGLVGRTGASVGWLVAMYLLLLVAPPQTAVLLAVVGVVDNWFDFRAYFGRPRENN